MPSLPSLNVADASCITTLIMKTAVLGQVLGRVLFFAKTIARSSYDGEDEDLLSQIPLPPISGITEPSCVTTIVVETAERRQILQAITRAGKPAGTDLLRARVMIDGKCCPCKVCC